MTAPVTPVMPVAASPAPSGGSDSSSGAKPFASALNGALAAGRDEAHGAAYRSGSARQEDTGESPAGGLRGGARGLRGGTAADEQAGDGADEAAGQPVSDDGTAAVTASGLPAAVWAILQGGPSATGRPDGDPAAGDLAGADVTAAVATAVAGGAAAGPGAVEWSPGPVVPAAAAVPGPASGQAGGTADLPTTGRPGPAGPGITGLTPAMTAALATATTTAPGTPGTPAAPAAPLPGDVVALAQPGAPGTGGQPAPAPFPSSALRPAGPQRVDGTPQGVPGDPGALPRTPVTDPAGPAVAAPAPGAGRPAGAGETASPDRATDAGVAPADTVPAAGAMATAAPAAATTAPSTAPAQPPPAHVAAQLVPHVATLGRGPDGSHSLTLVLHPDSLGAVQVQVTVTQGTVDLAFRGAHEHGRAALLEAMPELRRELQSAGLDCSRMDVDRDTGGSWTAQHSAAGDGRGQPPWARSGQPEGRRSWAQDVAPDRPAPRIRRTSASSGVDVLA